MLKRFLVLGVLGLALALALAGCFKSEPRDETPTPGGTAGPSGLVLVVNGPIGDTTVFSDAVVVHGRTSVGAALTVGGVPVNVEGDGRFQTVVPLTLGPNVIEIVAIDGSGVRSSATLTVTYEESNAPAFFLLVTEPQDQSVVRTGRIPLVGKTAPGAIVSVNGVGLNVDGAGDFSTTITLDTGPNLIEIVGTSQGGRVLSTVLAVIFRP